MKICWNTQYIWKNFDKTIILTEQNQQNEQINSNWCTTPAVDNLVFSFKYVYSKIPAPTQQALQIKDEWDTAY